MANSDGANRGRGRAGAPWLMETAQHGNGTQMGKTGRPGSWVGVEHALVQEVTPGGSPDPAYRGLQRLLPLMSCNTEQIRLDMPILRCFLLLFFSTHQFGASCPVGRRGSRPTLKCSRKGPVCTILKEAHLTAPFVFRATVRWAFLKDITQNGS